MQSITLFALAIGAFAVIHFIDQLETRYRSTVRPTSGKQRRNWYCFFSLDALYGEQTTPAAEDREEQRPEVADRRPDIRRQQEQRRPQIRL